MPTTLLFIVTRRQRDLYEYVLRRFANEPDVRVLLDRRIADRRRAPAPRSAPDERRQAQRRQNSEVSYQLLTMGYAFARPETGVS
jgi:hypothetical protein